MSTKNSRKTRNSQIGPDSLKLSSIDGLLNEPEQNGVTGYVKRHWVKGAVVAFVFVLGLGVMAKNDWLPRTDPLSGKKTGWFGTELPKNAASNWNPFAVPVPSPPLQVSKEYIYAGSRLLSAVDSNVNEIPPDDLAVWRPSNGYWYVKGGPGSTQTSFPWGQTGDIPAQGDYDGDGKTDFCVYRPDPNDSTIYTWYIYGSASGNMGSVVFSGVDGLDTPAVADFDGDGKTDLSARQSSGDTWRIKYSSNENTIDTTFGGAGEKPVPADYDGDGKADLAVWRDSDHTFLWKSSFNGQEQEPVSIGTGEFPVCADYDGDGKADFALLIDGNVWRIRSSSTESTDEITFEVGPYTPVPNDYDGDGKVDIAEFHISGTGKTYSGVWKILQSHDQETRTETWGTLGDIPVPAFYRR